MKRCPQCDSVFGDDVVYCQNDGMPLIEEIFSLPSSNADFEAETVIRREPIVVDLSPANTPVEDVNYKTAPVVENVIVREFPAKSNSTNAAIYLVLGLVLGGILVLTTLLLARSFYADKTNDNSKQIAVNVSETKPKTSPAITENRNENKNALTETTNLKHAQPTTADDEEFNGRVIATNAYVRASASKSTAQIDVLPLNDRINIERRENENSPWFYVECEHGTSGWMHGDTIEYTK